MEESSSFRKKKKTNLTSSPLFAAMRGLCHSAKQPRGSSGLFAVRMGFTNRFEISD